jgi:preprotein translocase subunit Sss1
MTTTEQVIAIVAVLGVGFIIYLIIKDSNWDWFINH